MSKLIKIFFILYYSSTIAFAQQPTLEWAASYHNPVSYAYSMSADNLGNIFLAGIYYPTPQRSVFLTLKYNSSGIFQWNKYFQGPDTIVTGGVDLAYKCIADGAGNVYVAGQSYDNSNGEDVLIIKYNTKGDTIWTARYNEPSSGGDVFSDIVIDKFANIYVGCRSFGFTAIKYDSSGNKLWRGYYSFGTPASIAVDSSYNVYLTGRTLSGFGFQYTTVKFNSSGELQWIKNYTPYWDAKAISVAVDKQRNVYVTGTVDSSNLSYSKILTIKYDSLGNEIWLRGYKSLFFWRDEAFKVLLDTSGNPLISGTGLIKYNSNGDFLWADTMAGGRTIALDKQNNIYIASDTNINTFNNKTMKTSKNENQLIKSRDLSIQALMRTIKYDQNGNRQWAVTFGSIVPGGMLYGPSDIFIDNNYSIYVAGAVIAGQNEDSIILLKYSQPIGISGYGNQIPNKFELYQNYPNPFNPKTIIKYVVKSKVKSEKAKIVITIYDATGKIVTTLVNEEQKAGTYEVEWNASNFSSGVYFYSLIVDNLVVTKKMILLK